jgi:hypothetical protein
MTFCRNKSALGSRLGMGSRLRVALLAFLLAMHLASPAFATAIAPCAVLDVCPTELSSDAEPEDVGKLRTDNGAAPNIAHANFCDACGFALAQFSTHSFGRSTSSDEASPATASHPGWVAIFDPPPLRS